MNPEDLRRMLDLEGKHAPPEPPDAHDLASDAIKIPASPTALELDEWGQRRGREMLDEHLQLRKLHLDSHAVADFFGCGFEPDPVLAPDCVEPLRREFVEQLLQTPEYHALHSTTVLNEAASSLTALALAEQFADLRDKSQKRDIKDLVDREMDTLRAVGRAITEASKEVEEADETARAFGLGPGSPGSNDATAIARLYRQVRSNPSLRRICVLAGRFRRVAQSKQRQKTAHGLDDLVGVVMDGELSRLLPHELAKLVIPELELDLLRRLVERQVMCREYRAVEHIAKGPILVSVDESGSMAGTKVETAKALALALAWIARRQRRWCGLVAYSGETGERLLALPPGRWDEEKVIAWLDGFLGCGSERDVPVAELPGYYDQLQAPRGKTDVILITDAICKIPYELRLRFNAWKQAVQARVISLVIESGPGDLTAISDEIHCVPALKATEAGVEHVLSL